MKAILIISKNAQASTTISNCLQNEYRVEISSEKDERFNLIKTRRYEFIFIDLAYLSEGVAAVGALKDYKSALQPYLSALPSAEIIVLSPPEQIRDAVSAVKAGASNYLTFPISPEEVKYLTESIREALRMQSELDYLRDTFWQTDSLELIKTNNSLMKEVFNKIKLVAQTNTTVLLTGETGTGKGIIAKLIHRHSNRSNKPFISVHCGAIPEALLESELFGHEKGAFTGAIRRKLGKFEVARGGTIFLDEIGTVTASTQIKLLQVLQDKIIQRIGGEEIIETDVRIIAATNDDLDKLRQNGAFRSDLYFRLNVFPINIPPLRERLEDISLLIETFLNRLNLFYGKRITTIHPQVMQAFENYLWPGNIRELENLIERAYILETSSMMTPESFPGELFTLEAPKARITVNTELTLAEVRRQGVENIERHYLKELLTQNKGSIKNTASAAGISERYLNKLMIKHGLRKEDFKNIA